MRLSDFAPRLNGIVAVNTLMGPPIKGMGATTGESLALATVSSALQSFLASLTYAAAIGNATPPDQFLAALQYDVTNACTNVLNPSEACDPNSATIQSAIHTAYLQYLSSYTSAPTPNVLNTSAPGQSATSVTGAMTINNVSGGSSSQFRVGDGYRVVISGAPNQPVLVSGTKNNSSLGNTQMGTTDSYGNFVMTGVMGAGDIGNWTEKWAVGGQVVGQTSFSVVNAAPTALTPPVTAPAVTSTQVLNNQTQGGSQATANGTSGSNVSATESWFTQSTLVSFIPNWAVVGAGGLVAFLMLKGK